MLLLLVLSSSLIVCGLSGLLDGDRVLLSSEVRKCARVRSLVDRLLLLI